MAESTKSSSKTGGGLDSTSSPPRALPRITHGHDGAGSLSLVLAADGAKTSVVAPVERWVPFFFAGIELVHDGIVVPHEEWATLRRRNELRGAFRALAIVEVQPGQSEARGRAGREPVFSNAALELAGSVLSSARTALGETLRGSRAARHRIPLWARRWVIRLLPSGPGGTPSLVVSSRGTTLADESLWEGLSEAAAMLRGARAGKAGSAA